MRFVVKFWWPNPEELTQEECFEDDSMAPLSREHFLSLIEQGAFGDKPEVIFDLQNCGVTIVATVKVDRDVSQSDFMQGLFYKLSAWVIGKQA